MKKYDFIKSNSSAGRRVYASKKRQDALVSMIDYRKANKSAKPEAEERFGSWFFDKDGEFTYTSN